MKVKLGFVSNSSSTSFCIYGWNIEYGEGKKIRTLLEEVMKKESILDFQYAEGEDWIGIGESGTPEVDEDGDIVDEDIPDLSTEDINKVDEIAKKYSLPKPEMTSGCWYNG